MARDKTERMIRTLKHWKKQENKMVYRRSKAMDDRRTRRNKTRAAQEQRALDEYYNSYEEDYGDFEDLILEKEDE